MSVVTLKHRHFQIFKLANYLIFKFKTVYFAALINKRNKDVLEPGGDGSNCR